MIHTYLCRAPRTTTAGTATTTTTTAGTTTAGASTVLPSDQPANQPTNQPLLLFLFRPNTLALDASLLLSVPLSLFFGRLAARLELPLTLAKTRQQARKAGKRASQAEPGKLCQGAIGLRSVWVANQNAKVRIPSTRRFHVAVENHHEDAT